MTLIEIEAQKASLVRQILTEINTEEAINKLTDFFQKIRKDNTSVLPSELLNRLMAQAEQDDDNGMVVTPEEMDREIQSW